MEGEATASSTFDNLPRRVPRKPKVARLSRKPLSTKICAWFSASYTERGASTTSAILMPRRSSTFFSLIKSLSFSLAELSLYNVVHRRKPLIKRKIRKRYCWICRSFYYIRVQFITSFLTLFKYSSIILSSIITYVLFYS